MADPGTAVLSDLQLATLAEHGEERTAAVGETLFEVGDQRYPFIAILEGEAAVQSPAGQELIRQGASGFLGEMSLLSGQTAFLTAVVTTPMRYIAVDCEVLRPLLVEDSSLADLLLWNFMRRREALQGRLSGRHQRRRAHEPGGDTGVQVPGADRHTVSRARGRARPRAPRRAPRGDHEIAARAVVLATGAEYRRLPVADLESYEGISVFYAAGPPEAQRCGATRVGVIGGGNSAAQAAIWLARGGALVTLVHRRRDLRETMSDYLIPELERYGVAVRDRSEVAELHGTDGELEAVTLLDGERLPFSFLFLFLGAVPCIDWLDDTVARDAKGFILTGRGRRCLGCSRRASPGSMRPATFARARSSGVPQRWARVRWSFA